MEFIILRNNGKKWHIFTKRGKTSFSTLSLAKRVVNDAKTRYKGEYMILESHLIGELFHTLREGKRRLYSQMDLEIEAGKRPRGDQ